MGNPVSASTANDVFSVFTVNVPNDWSVRFTFTEKSNLMVFNPAAGSERVFILLDEIPTGVPPPVAPAPAAVNVAQPARFLVVEPGSLPASFSGLKFNAIALRSTAGTADVTICAW